MKHLYASLTEYERTAVDYQTFCSRITHNKIVALKGASSPVLIGQGLGLRFNSSIGLNSTVAFTDELAKIIAISKHPNRPNTMMDLSTVRSSTPLHIEIQNRLGCPVGTIPYYICFDPQRGINDNELLETIEEQAQNGVAFMTLHLTANLDLAKKSLVRNIPIISRGGSLLLRDMQINKRKDNILITNLDRIVRILKEYNVVVSIGTTFRPSTQYDALDATHLGELNMQIELSEYLKNLGLQVIMEGIGHISFHRIPEYCSILRERNYIPFMPLGPIVSDHTHGQDHITSSVGAAYLASLGGADIINSVTREEHTGGIPTVRSILEAIDAANAVIQIVNDSRFPSHFCKGNIRHHNCMGIPEEVGCTRCNEECPFIWNEQNQTKLPSTQKYL